MRSNNQYLVENIINELYCKDMLNSNAVSAETVIRDFTHQYMKEKELFLLNKHQINILLTNIIILSRLDSEFDSSSNKIDKILEGINGDSNIGGGR